MCEVSAHHARPPRGHAHGARSADRRRRARTGGGISINSRNRRAAGIEERDGRLRRSDIESTDHVGRRHASRCERQTERARPRVMTVHRRRNRNTIGIDPAQTVDRADRDRAVAGRGHIERRHRPHHWQNDRRDEIEEDREKTCHRRHAATQPAGEPRLCQLIRARRQYRHVGLTRSRGPPQRDRRADPPIHKIYMTPGAATTPPLRPEGRPIRGKNARMRPYHPRPASPRTPDPQP